MIVFTWYKGASSHSPQQLRYLDAEACYARELEVMEIQTTCAVAWVYMYVHLQLSSLQAVGAPEPWARAQ